MNGFYRHNPLADAAASHHAALRRFRAARAPVLNALRMSAHAPYMIYGLLPGAVLFVGLTVWMTVDAATSKPELAHALPMMWLIMLFTAGWPIGSLVWRDALRERAARALESGVAWYASRPIAGVAERMEWLDANWAGPTPFSESAAGPSFRSAAMCIDDFPAMVAISPVAFDPRGSYAGYLTVHLAAWIPALHQAESFDPRWIATDRQALLSLGLQLSVEPAGLKAYATASAARRLLWGASAGAKLAWAIAHLHQAAKALNALPSPA